MTKTRKVKNAYEELGFADSGEMLIKAKLALQITQILHDRGWS